MLHGTPRVTDPAARKANEAAGLLGVAGFANVAVLRAHVAGPGGETLPAAAAGRRVRKFAHGARGEERARCAAPRE